jgi:RHS repeat-associated protein
MTTNVDAPPSPVGLPSGVSAQSIAVGTNHVCALLLGGGVSCWGSDTSGQLGNGATTGNVVSPPSAIQLPGGAKATAIAAGDLHTCALLQSGQISCWGSDGSGQLGNGAVTGTKDVPQAPVALPATSATAIAAAGNSTCAVLNTGGVSCWGSDSTGQLGNGSAASQVSPPSAIALPAGTTAVSVVAGLLTVCAVLNTGGVSCWGSDLYGQLGDGSPYGATSTTPTAPLVLPGTGTTARAVSVGYGFACALLSTYRVSCWGADTNGQIGNGPATPLVIAPPAPVALPSAMAVGAAAIDVGDNGVCVIRVDNQLSCWGKSMPSQPSAAIGMPGGVAPSQASVGWEHFCTVLASSQVTCWGSAGNGALGNGQSTGSVSSPPPPVALPGGSPAVQVASGFFYTCAVLSSGQVTCWGSDGNGVLGNGAPTASVLTPPSPIVLPSPGTASSISVGLWHVCALQTDGQISCWGNDDSGQVGNGAATGDVVAPSNPVALPSPGSAVAVTVGARHTCALLTGGQVTCWGLGGTGALGNGSTTGNVDAPPAPVVLPSGTTGTAISAGYDHTCALLNTGQVTCWGSDNGGALGNGAGGLANVPPAPVTLPGGATAVAIGAGDDFSCALLNSGQVACWGSNYLGNLGNGTGAESQVPVLAGTPAQVAPQPIPGSAPPVMVVKENTIGQQANANGYAADPVNTASGNLVDSHVDLGGEAFGLDVVRTYNTFDADPSVLSSGWRAGTGARLEESGADVRFELVDGSSFEFTDDGSGGWVTPPGLKAELAADPSAPAGGGTLPMLRVSYLDGTVERFDTQGRSIEQIAWDGRTATTAYGASGRVETVTASTEQTLTFSYDGNDRLSAVALSNGRSVSYGYDAAGLLSEFTDEHAATTTMAYTPQGWLQTVTEPGGVVKMSNTFDAQGRVVTQSSAAGGVTTFTYSVDEGATYVHDSVSNTSVRYQHDADGRIIAMTDPFGRAVARNYDADSNLTSGTDRADRTDSATYDANGNLTSVTQPGVGTTSYGYDAANRVTSMTDPTAAATTFTYEAAERIPSTVTNHLNQTTTQDVVDGLVMSVTDADGVTTTYGYNTQRLLASVTNEYNESTNYEYDTRGHRTKATSPGGRETVWEYDPVTHHLASLTAPDGGITSYTYDPAGRVLTVTDPTNAVTTNTYDIAGRPLTVTEPGGAVTTYQYDANGRLTKTIEPGGGEASTAYGPLGRVTSTKDQLNRSTTYEYDAEGRTTKTTDPAAGVDQTLYDAAGRPFKTIDARNRETIKAYDQYGRIFTLTEPGGRVTTYGYDALSRVTTVTDARGGTTTTAFTPGGRVDTITNAAGLITDYGYDLAGRRTGIVAPGSLTTTINYNPDSEVATTTAPGGLTTTITYDPGGRVATVTDPAGVVTTNTWSLRGELLTTKTGQEGTVTYTYNLNGTLVTASDALGAVTTFGYDARRNLTSRTAPNGAVFGWTYSAADELLTSVDPLGRTTTFTYDPAGRPKTVTDATGKVQTNNYYPDGTLNTVAYTGGTTTTYGYDTAGRATSMTDATGAYTFAYEPGGQLTSMLTPTGRQTTWTYDTAGRRTAIGYPDGSTYGYNYDTAGRLWKIIPGEVLADTFTATAGAFADSGRWTIAATNGNAQIDPANRLSLFWTNVASATASVTSKSSAAQDSEQVVRYQFSSTSSTTVGKFNVRARSSASSNIRIELTSNSTTARIYKQIGSTSTQLGTFTTTVGTAPRWLRLQVTGTTVKVRTWADGSAEPTTWNATVTNATGVSTSGVPRLEAVRTSGANQVTIDHYRHTDPTNPLTPAVTYGYNNDSQVTTETLPGGSRTRGYLNGRITSFTQTLPGLTTSTSRTYDTTGRIATETSGAVTTTYGYDAAGQLVSATPNTGTASSWAYDQIGQRSTQTIGATATRHQYDAAGQLCWTTTAAMPSTPTCGAPPVGATRYTYDNSGRLLTETVDATNNITHTYDPAGRLATSVRLVGGTSTTQTRTYNPLNHLTGFGVSSSNTTLDWDPTQGATQLLGITQIASGTLATNDLVGGIAGWAATRTGIHNAIGVDIYGSAITSAATGSLTRAASYDAFGTPAGNNTLDVRLGYRGELTIERLVHLRARDLQPAIARFTSSDPVPGRPGQTVLNNEYHYADNQPLQSIDPFGLSTSSDGSNGGTGISFLAAAAGVLTFSPVDEAFWAFAEQQFARSAMTRIAINFAPGLSPSAYGAGGVTMAGFAAFVIEADLVTKTFIHLYETSKLQQQLAQRLSNEAINAELATHTGIWRNPDGSVMDPQPDLATTTPVQTTPINDSDHEPAPQPTRQLDTSGSGARSGTGNNNCDATNTGGGGAEPPPDNSDMSIDDVLDAASAFLGAGYSEVPPGSGRFVSADGTRVVRMKDSDITGRHGRGPHANFETLECDPKTGRMRVVDNRHVYFKD